MEAAAALRDYASIAETLLGRGFVVYFAGRPGVDATMPHVEARLADIGNAEYRTESSPAFIDTSPLEAARAALTWANDRRPTAIRPYAEGQALGALYAGLADQGFTIAWWATPQDLSAFPWVALLYSSTVAVCDVGTGNSPMEAAFAAVQHLNLDYPGRDMYYRRR